MIKKAQSFLLAPAMAASLLLALPSGVQAATVPASDALIEGARQCTQYFPVEEQKNSIPTHLLAAIATTESGRWHEGLGMNVPWPWTINVDGKGYFFDSKAQAMAQVRSLLAQGKQSIDVGCMQVNLKHHPKAFANLDQAFDPATNVAYAAKFLHDNYGELHDWIKATAAYHSRTPVYGARYLTDIERSWNRIVAKVAAARASKNGEATTAGLGESTPPAPGLATTASSRPASGSNGGQQQFAAAAKVMNTPHKSRVIQVSDAPRNTGQVMVIRATPSPAPVAVPVAPVTVAQAGPAVVPVAASYTPGDSVRRVNLDNTTAPAVPKDGPKFVFAN